MLPLSPNRCNLCVRSIHLRGIFAAGFVSRGLIGEPVAVRPTAEEGVYRVAFCHKVLGIIDLANPKAGVTPVSEQV